MHLASYLLSGTGSPGTHAYTDATAAAPWWEHEAAGSSEPSSWGIVLLFTLQPYAQLATDSVLLRSSAAPSAHARGTVRASNFTATVCIGYGTQGTGRAGGRPS
ncbi:MAG: hypothetical protein PVSMB4_04410 [Ktedonobacterales bacterium]